MKFSCLFIDRDGVEVHKLAKKERGHPVIFTEQAWSIKDLLYGFRKKNFLRDKARVGPGGQDRSILPTRVANHSAGFDSSCLLTRTELAI